MANIIRVEDSRDPRLAVYRQMRANPADLSNAGCFVVEGRWCVQRLAESQHEILSLLVERGREAVASHCVDEQTPIYSLPGDQVRDLVGFDFHRGMIACGARPTLQAFDRLRLGADQPNIALAVLGVDQTENLGSMMRSAAALGVRDVLIGPRTADPFARRTVRVSMAAVLHQQLYSLDDPAEQLQSLAKDKGYRTVVTTLGNAVSLDQFVHDDRPLVLIVGNEADGVSAEIERIATDRVTIPMKLGTDSLNVAVATAIFLYQLASGMKN
ncbi:MAG: RNA methyltransferase [Rubripirellula sp.]|nr:RNA methyltransferase [Rubripirellula sp.]